MSRSRIQEDTFAARCSVEEPDYAQLAAAKAAVELAMGSFRLPFGNDFTLGMLDTDAFSSRAQLPEFKRKMAELAALTPFFKNVPLKETVDEFLSLLKLTKGTQLHDQASRDLVAEFSTAALRAVGTQPQRG